MNTHSRRFALPLATIAMLAGTLAVAAPAQAASSTVTDIGALQTAASSCTNGDVVTVGADITAINADVTTGCTMTLDLGDKKLSLSRVAIGAGTTLTIRGDATASGTLTARSGDGAAIRTTSASLVIDSGTVNASTFDAYDGIGGAAIGTDGYDGAVSGTVTINGGQVTAVSNTYGAGIGGGEGSNGGITTINGGDVTATGGVFASGIGSGANPYETQTGGTVTITGGTVRATGTVGGAGIGGGIRSAGATVTIGKGADVTAVGGDRQNGGGPVTAIGAGDGYGETWDFGTLAVAGTLRVPAGTNLTVPQDATATVASTGVITGSTGSTDGGQIYGPGTIDNGGSIRLPSDQVVDATTPAIITDHHYAVSFDTQGGAAAPSPVTVFAESFVTGGRDFPSDPTKAGQSFAGWNSEADGSGASITTSSSLPGSATGAPVPVTAYAQFAPPAVTPPAAPDASITGTVREDRTLTARTGLPAGTAAATYRWKADGRTIKGATSSTLRLGKKQAARRVTVTVTAGGRSSTSKATKIVTSKRARIVVTPTRIGKRDYFRVTAVGLTKRQKIRVWLGGRRVLIGKADSRGVVDRQVRFSRSTDAGKRRVRVSGYSRTDKRTFTVKRTVRYLSR